jgi:hypothetical protein
MVFSCHSVAVLTASNDVAHRYREVVLIAFNSRNKIFPGNVRRFQVIQPSEEIFFEKLLDRLQCATL